jgi:NAD-dependent deacetylase
VRSSLDGDGEQVVGEQCGDIDAVAKVIAANDRVVALTGAGVSTASGVPDFRGPSGLWTRDPRAERLSSIDVYISDAEARREVWRQRLAAADAGLRPNPAHHALAELEGLDRLERLVTQNVDGLHQDAGSDPARVVEIHGTTREAVCLDGDWRGPMSDVLDRVRAGDTDPHCSCGGLLKSATVSFGQSLDPAQLQRAHDATIASEVFLAIGSSLVVHPVALLPQVALEAGATLVVCNAEPTDYDERAHHVLHVDVSEALPELVSRVRSRLVA